METIAVHLSSALNDSIRLFASERNLNFADALERTIAAGLNALQFPESTGPHEAGAVSSVARSACGETGSNTAKMGRLLSVFAMEEGVD